VNSFIKLKLDAISDLLDRYSSAWKSAWAEESLAPHNRFLRSEAEFLPSALALQETPVSPAPRVAIWILILLVAGALAWSYIGKVEVVATASGKVIAVGRTKTIQSADTATVRRVLVGEGDEVNQGDVLVELDSTISDAEADRAEDAIAYAELRLAKAKALLISIDTRNLSPLGVINTSSEDEIKEASDWLASEYQEFSANAAHAESELVQRQAELNSILEAVRSLEATLPIVQRRTEALKSLSESKLIPTQTYLEQEEARLSKEGDLALQRSRQKEAVAAIHEAQRSIEAMVAQRRREALDEQNAASADLSQLRQQLIQAKARTGLMTLTAPVSGTVQQLVVHTVGGVVTPAQPIMSIVPSKQPVEVEAFIENRDAGFVKVGMNAEVKVETYRFTKYGTLKARVTHVSHDSIEDEKRGLLYTMRVAVDSDELASGDERVRVFPGMAVAVEVKTGERRLIEFLLSPIQKYQSESFKER
jgi:hemolysin D